MNPLNFPGVNRNYTAPAGMDNCGTLPFTSIRVSVTPSGSRQKMSVAGLLPARTWFCRSGVINRLSL